MRELFEVHRNETEKEKVHKLVESGWKHLQTLKQVASIDEDSFNTIFDTDNLKTNKE